MLRAQAPLISFLLLLSRTCFGVEIPPGEEALSQLNDHYYAAALNQAIAADVTVSADPSVESISFPAAVSLAAAIQRQQDRATRPHSISMPTNASDYYGILQLANSTPQQVHANVKASEESLSDLLRGLIPNPNAAPSPLGKEGLDKRQSARKVMIVGDSLTQGNEGDYTWRYRIWEWFRANNVAVDFVGPYSGTQKPPAPNPGPPLPPPLASAPSPAPSPPSVDGTYAAGVAAGFDSDHFAVWGRPAAIDKGLIQNMVSTYQPDLMLLMLGFNDMGWFYTDGQGTLDTMKTLVNNARAANPKLTFAIADVPQRKLINGRQDLVDKTTTYNSLLAKAIPSWTSTQSPISLVKLQANYDCSPSSCPAGYDGLHPSELGEYQIARAFTMSLVNDLKIGSSVLTIPANVPVRPLPKPTNFKFVSSPQGVTATWDPVYGAYTYDVTSSINGGTLWNYSPGSSPSNRWDSRWALDGWTYDIQVRASAGDTRKGAWVAGTAVAHPQTAPAPINVKVSPTSGGVDISWDPPTGPNTDSIVEYNVIYWDLDSCAWINGAAYKSSPAHLTGFTSGHHIFTSIEVWNKNGAGFPAINNQAIAGYGAPSPPTGLVVDSTDSTSVHLTWNAAANAAGYAIWTRNINDAKSISTRQNATTLVPCSDYYYLFPGTWNYEFCISALNGNSESSKGNCVVAPSPTATHAAATCPAPPSPPTGCGFNDNSGSGSGSGDTPPSGSASPTTSIPAPSSSNTPGPWPVVSNGQCRGPDCKNGHCVGVLCASFGCKGTDCFDGVCNGPNCIPLGCSGARCSDGVCNGAGCITRGCIGSQCGSNGVCGGINCISLGCIGLDCPSSGICSASRCSESWCLGINCANGICSSTCTDGGTIGGGGSQGTTNPSSSPSSCSTATTSTVSDCSVNCGVLLGEGAPQTVCANATCIHTTTGCGVYGTTVSLVTTWTCPDQGYVAPLPPKTGGPTTPTTGGGGQSPTSPTSPTTSVTTANPPACSPKTAPGLIEFYVWDATHLTCTPGTGGACSPDTPWQDAVSTHNWDCNFLSSLPHFNSVMYKASQSPQPSTFTLAKSGETCATADLVFTQQCDGSYLVTPSSGGGYAVCSRPQPGISVSCSQGYDNYAFTVDLDCAGNICFN